MFPAEQPLMGGGGGAGLGAGDQMGGGGPMQQQQQQGSQPRPGGRAGSVAEAVNPEPKLFIGQLLPSLGQGDVVARFCQYGPVKNCTLMVNPESGKSKGCAMVTYERFAHAEAALAVENGSFYLSGDRPLVVKFADPTRKEDGRVVGITPKKLFVGQVVCASLGWGTRGAARCVVRRCVPPLACLVAC